MTTVTESNLDAERLRALRQQKAWRAIIELGEQLLARQGNGMGILARAELGKAYLEVRQYDAARNVLQPALERQPGHPLINRRMAELESSVGNYGPAIRYWQTLKKRKAGNVDSSTFYYLANAYRRLGDLDAARQNASQGHARFPENPKLRDELRRIEWMLEDQSAPGEGGPPPASPPKHPYCDLADRNYWNRTVSQRNALDIDSWYTRKFSIKGLSISTAGSCFAQHIGRELREKGYEYVDVEPAPDFLRAESHHDYGYGIYSARFGNVYTSRQLLQLIQRSLQLFEPQDSVWEKDDGYVDAFRPTIEPEPYKRVEDVLESRRNHLAAVERMFKVSNVFVFTLGLTETWMSAADGAVYPVAPGVAGGKYDAGRYQFRNLTYSEVLEDMDEFISLVRRINANLKIILTVSPVPLIATATSNNVVVASSYSKSVLRSVAGHLSDKYEFVDYFPSYEIVGSHVMRGQFFNPDGRTVSPHGVSHVMKHFFAEHAPPPFERAAKPKSDAVDDVVCDEELLNEFGLPGSS